MPRAGYATRKMKLDRISGRVHRIVFESPTFMVGNIETENGMINFAGGISGIKIDDYIALHGQFIDHAKFGRQFKTSYFLFDQKPNANGLAAWLAGNKEFANIGPKRANEIVKRCGDNFDKIIRDHPDELLTIRGITRDTVALLRDKWISQSEYNAAATELAAMELTTNQIQKLLEKYGGEAASVIKENPYRLIDDVDGIAFKSCDKIARRAGHLKDNPARIRAGLLFIMSERLNDGHTCVDAVLLCRMANELLTIDRERVMESIMDMIENLIVDGLLFEIKIGGICCEN
jgi:exodeoxyribonuclease V alpha subunit